ncbi:hypothetical protein J8F10_06030 [Gemmata sp. G18]|uniref:GNAT family N-acetyltransferase n=1 Tax=Gemmata palustris TaxID=2822762 RepID=A0ABS5BME4_9BACT|nr:hypothetical protein [Gemmata palustris]MBP3954840.1 hypothetical protein [Gemmata palustris]
MSTPLAIRPDAVDIVAPLIRGAYLPSARRVTARSPRSHRRAVYRLAEYCRREMGYALQYGYDGEEDDPDHVAFLWPHPEAVGASGTFRVPCVGAACFRLRDHGWALQWVWMHPYFRRHGLLSGEWPALVWEFGAFAVEGPLSHAMTRFLAKSAHPGDVV